MLARTYRRPAPPPTIRSGRFPAPIGGVNTVDAASEMSERDALWMYNLIAAEYGLRSRLGFKEWCTGLGGEIRSMLAFTGSRANGSTNKIFACTPAGIWDVSASTDEPSQVVTFGITSGEAGWGISTVIATPAGRFLAYCDEENGLYLYSEESTTWSKVALGTTALWAPNTAVQIGNRVVNGGKVYQVATAGVTAGSGGPTGTGTAIADGTAAWDYVSAAATGVIGPSLADQQFGYSGDPANFAFVVVWKSRVWLVEKNTTRAWYLDINSIFGTATSFDFGSRMRAGGALVGLFNWSYDGGAGMDTLLVGVSGAGDVVIFGGTDPTSANTFGLKGTWSVGAVPSGRRIVTDYGGDILLLSLVGVLPLSKLVIGGAVDDEKLYATQKIANTFNVVASTFRSLHGWALQLQPEDNALLILVPVQDGQPTTQLAMSFATRGWSQYRDLPILSSAIWNGQLYFGTADGRVCINTGYVDEVTLADPNAFRPVQWSVLTSYQDLGRPTHKRVQTVRPMLVSMTPTPLVRATARYNYDLSEPAPPAGAASGKAGTWDNATWDGDVWGGEYSPSYPVGGALGMGRDVAIAIRGSAISRTVLVKTDVTYLEGGVL